MFSVIIVTNSEVAGLWETEKQIYFSEVRSLKIFAKLCKAAQYSVVKEHLFPKSKFFLNSFDCHIN